MMERDREIREVRYETTLPDDEGKFPAAPTEAVEESYETITTPASPASLAPLMGLILPQATVLVPPVTPYPQWICTRCDHNWVGRQSEPPIACPKCKSPYWNMEKGERRKKTREQKEEAIAMRWLNRQKAERTQKARRIRQRVIARRAASRTVTRVAGRRGYSSR